MNDKRFAFTDLHSFKDYVGFVMLCAPDGFPSQDLVPSTAPWTLEMAFDGLRIGIMYYVAPRCTAEALEGMTVDISEALQRYQSGDTKGGFAVMRLLDQKISRLRSR